ncbi:MAG: hypothetical protein CMM22_00580 [Rhodospirillaceae bacterium]|nr:hypothetical protein [Rhodospirillaceae bacterium]|tara:strand:- start:430 stop:702 length:273 start_codon:yes stop_codon:yes gene_type:complete
MDRAYTPIPITAQTNHACHVERRTEPSPDYNAAWCPFYFHRFLLEKLDFSGINRFYRGSRKMRGLFHIVNRIFIDIFFIKNQFVTLYFQS